MKKSHIYLSIVVLIVLIILTLIYIANDLSLSPDTKLYSPGTLSNLENYNPESGEIINIDYKSNEIALKTGDGNEFDVPEFILAINDSTILIDSKENLISISDFNIGDNVTFYYEFDYFVTLPAYPGVVGVVNHSK